MRFSDISRIRLHNHQIARSDFSTIKGLVGWMGALQAQDFEMLKWALGVRIPDLTMEAFDRAFTSGEIIRTHLLRPTWHLVTAEDLPWIMAATAPRLKKVMKPRLKDLGISSAMLNKCFRKFEEVLDQQGILPRQEMVSIIENVGIDITENRPSHVLMWAEFEGIICSGPYMKGTAPVYALLCKRVNMPTALPDWEESLARLAVKYFTSHGPATLRDFAWWSGATLTQARKVVGALAKTLASIDVEGETYWFNRDKVDKGSKQVVALPAYDEFIISYKDRRICLEDMHYKNVISINGIFRPVLIQNGKVRGMWKRKFSKQHVEIELYHFRKPDETVKRQADQALQKYADFMGREADIRHLQMQ